MTHKYSNRDRACFADHIATEFDCLSAALYLAAREVEEGKQIQAFMDYNSNLEERWHRLVTEVRDIEDRLGINLLDIQEFDPDNYEIIVTVNKLEEEEDGLSPDTNEDSGESVQDNSGS